MDRTVWIGAALLVALGLAGLYLTLSAGTLSSSTADADAIRAIGAALFGAGLASFIVVALHADYHSRRQ
jgi:hypothetical protein